MQQAHQEVLRRRLCQDGPRVRVQLFVRAGPAYGIIAGGRQCHLEDVDPKSCLVAKPGGMPPIGAQSKQHAYMAITWNMLSVIQTV